MRDLNWHQRLCRKLRTPRIPPILNPSDRTLGIIILFTLLIAVSQGLDYIARPMDTAASLSVIEKAVNLDFWGAIFVVFATLALAGSLFSIWPAAIIGHGVLAFNYFAISLGVLWSLAENWQGYGWNTAVIYMSLAFFHGLIADGCYDEWAREWKHPPPSVNLIEGTGGHANL